MWIHQYMTHQNPKRKTFWEYRRRSGALNPPAAKFNIQIYLLLKNTILPEIKQGRSKVFKYTATKDIYLYTTAKN